jgi:hypothetical protein
MSDTPAHFRATGRQSHVKMEKISTPSEVYNADIAPKDLVNSYQEEKSSFYSKFIMAKKNMVE